MGFIRCLALAFAALLANACSTTYQPAKVDEQTGLYSAIGSVSPGGVSSSSTPVNFNQYGAIVLVADSNQYPSRLEFVARRALADLGFKNVVNIAELRRWAEDSKFHFADDKVTVRDLRDFSASVKPVLIVDIRYAWLGDIHHYAGMRVIDPRNDTALLTVSHPAKLWVSVDQEVLNPVLNEFRKWHRKVNSTGA